MQGPDEYSACVTNPVRYQVSGEVPALREYLPRPSFKRLISTCGEPSILLTTLGSRVFLVGGKTAHLFEPYAKILRGTTDCGIGSDSLQRLGK